MKKKYLFIFLSGLTLVLLVLGITYPMITINLDSSIDAGIASFNNRIIDTTRSILGTCKELYEGERYLVAFLIFFFSVILPVLKTAIFSMSLFVEEEKRKKMGRFLSIISKWSMADVFVVAIFLAYLATDGHAEVQSRKIKMMGFTLDVKFSAEMTTTLQTGFYFFLAYCLTSLLLYQISRTSFKKSI